MGGERERKTSTQMGFMAKSPQSTAQSVAAPTSSALLIFVPPEQRLLAALGSGEAHRGLAVPRVPLGPWLQQLTCCEWLMVKYTCDVSKKKRKETEQRWQHRRCQGKDMIDWLDRQSNKQGSQCSWLSLAADND